MRDFRFLASATPVLVLLVATLVWHTGGHTAPNTVEARGTADVLLTESLESKLSVIYSVAEKEIPLCLFGAKNERGTILERMAFPDQLSTTDSTVTFDGASCEARPDFLGYVHNHDPPASRCEPTPLDEARFALNADSQVELIACTREADVTYHAFVPWDLDRKNDCSRGHTLDRSDRKGLPHEVGTRRRAGTVWLRRLHAWRERAPWAGPVGATRQYRQEEQRCVAARTSVVARN